ncbi:MAG: two-component system chemotaxis response regulator CheY [Myxococcota bacterium]|jgi:two-component system chemotaxis response regulator CheY
MPERERKEIDRMRILIVDDSSVMRKIVSRTLRQAGFVGHDIEEAENGIDALAKISANEPDVVLTDWNMPEMTGIELAQAMNEKELGIPFAFITSECTAQMREAAKEAGAVAFLTKPFTAETMESVLGKILG